MDQFASIRPFTDNEAAEAIISLLNDKHFIAAIGHLRYSYLPRTVRLPLAPLIKYQLKRRLRNIHSLDAFQYRMSGYLDYMIKSTVNTLSFSGFDALAKSKNYLFISNHRDITLDPAFINYALFHQWQKSLRIAIGDNLLSNNFASIVMRLNKGFLVKRTENSPRKRLANLKQLSDYIQFCLYQDDHSVWLAQRAGRAKDGIDRTDPAIIKMLAMGKPRDMNFTSYINSLHIVPVSISYEYDPCDALKAQELYALATTGKYVKAANEDFTSIGKGILGYKGNVHIAFGKVLQGEFANAGAVADIIDQQIIGNYQLHASNLLAYEILHGHLPLGLSCNAEQRRFFEKRLSYVPMHLRDYWLVMYANPVVSKLALADA